MMDIELEKSRHEEWYKEKFPFLYKLYSNRMCRDEHEIAFANSETTWLAAKAQTVPEGFILIDQKNVENWYLDENESIWWEHDGIDNTLCDLPIGHVEEVHHKEFLIIKNNSLFAAIAWDEENNQPGTWEFFETKEKANEVSTYCKSMNETQGKSYDGK